MKRRALLKAAPALGFAGLLAGAVPAGASVAAETPIMTLYKEWRSIHSTITGDDHGLDDQSWDAQHERTWRICDQIMALPSKGASDVMIKVMVYTCNGDHGLPDTDDAFWAEARAIIGGVA